jgi:hypothetical protein
MVRFLPDAGPSGFPFGGTVRVVSRREAALGETAMR